MEKKNVQKMLAKIYNSDKIRKIRRKSYRGKIFLDTGSGAFRMSMHTGGNSNQKNVEKGVKIFNEIVKILRKQRFLTDYTPPRLPKYVKRFRKEDTLTKRRERSYKQVIEKILKR